jgi:hypothetical protein
MASKNYELAQECKRYSESCLYTSTSLFGWLKFLRIVRGLFVIVPLVLGSLAGGKLLIGLPPQANTTAIALFSFVAGVLPSIYAALKYDENLETCKKAAAEFKNLQDRFRLAALVSSKKAFTEFEADVAPLIDRYEKARQDSLTPPEWIFRRAQRKVQSGDYTFDVDADDNEDAIR